MAKMDARVSQVLDLELDDVLLDDGFVRFRDRKGKATTVFPLDEETRQALERYQFVRTGRDTDYLFTSIRGNRLSREQVRRAVQEAAVTANVMDEGETRFAKKFTPHTYWTVFTTLMCNEGMPDHILRYLRGIATTKPWTCTRVLIEPLHAGISGLHQILTTMSQPQHREMDSHQINEWRDRQGNLIGAAVYLSPDEAQQLQEDGCLEITTDS